MITNLSVTDMYMSMLSSRSIDEKFDLITKFSNSIRNRNEESTNDIDLFSSFNGDWSDISAEDLRIARTFTRTVETW